MSQVKVSVTNYPEFLADYRVICINSYITKYGDEYLILGVRSHLSSLYTDIICDIEHNYLAMGSEKYSETIKKAESLSLIEDCDRLLAYCQDRKVVA